MIPHRAALAFAILATSLAQTAPSGAAEMSAADQGIRYGQALAAVRTCPGARLTPKAIALEQGVALTDRGTFRDASDRIVAAWANAFACKDVDPAQTRDINGCRRAKILSCTTTWQEIGPDGTALRGLLEFRPEDAPDEAPPAPPTP
jgi:hypothetical protein